MWHRAVGFRGPPGSVDFGSLDWPISGPLSYRHLGPSAFRSPPWQQDLFLRLGPHHDTGQSHGPTYARPRSSSLAEDTNGRHLAVRLAVQPAFFRGLPNWPEAETLLNSNARSRIKSAQPLFIQNSLLRRQLSGHFGAGQSRWGSTAPAGQKWERTWAIQTTSQNKVYPCHPPLASLAPGRASGWGRDAGPRSRSAWKKRVHG